MSVIYMDPPNSTIFKIFMFLIKNIKNASGSWGLKLKERTKNLSYKWFIAPLNLKGYLPDL